MIPPLVVGYGNTLRGDDAAGVIAAELVRERLPGVDVVVVHDIQPELAEALTRRPLVIFLDAAEGIEELVCATIDTSAPVPPVQSHLFSPSQILALCSSLYGSIPPKVYIVGIPAHDFSYAQEISALTAVAIEESVDVVGKLIEEHNRG